jgi:hypothetical protein
MTEATRRDQLTVLARKAAVLNKNRQPLMTHEEVFQVANVHPNKSISYKMMSNPWSNPKKGIVLEQGAIAFLFKPFEVTALLECDPYCSPSP